MSLVVEEKEATPQAIAFPIHFREPFPSHKEWVCKRWEEDPKSCMQWCLHHPCHNRGCCKCELLSLPRCLHSHLRQRAKIPKNSNVRINTQKNKKRETESRTDIFLAHEIKKSLIVSDGEALFVQCTHIWDVIGSQRSHRNCHPNLIMYTGQSDLFHFQKFQDGSRKRRRSIKTGNESQGARSFWMSHCEARWNCKLHIGIVRFSLLISFTAIYHKEKWENCISIILSFSPWTSSRR